MAALNPAGSSRIPGSPQVTAPSGQRLGMGNAKLVMGSWGGHPPAPVLRSRALDAGDAQLPLGAREQSGLIAFPEPSQQPSRSRPAW